MLQLIVAGLVGDGRTALAPKLRLVTVEFAVKVLQWYVPRMCATDTVQHATTHTRATRAHFIQGTTQIPIASDKCECQQATHMRPRRTGHDTH
jgi:hypothetical protein